MASINLGTFSDGFFGGSYTCYLLYDTPTRSGDYITIKNVKVQIVANQSYGTEGRVALNLYMPSSTSRVSNGTIAAAYNYPTNTTYTAVGSGGWQFSNLTTSFSFSITIADTGYSSSWSTTYSKTFTGSITCPERTYTVSYDANGGSGAPSDQSKVYNVTLALSSTIPTRSGYTFLGWATSSTSTTVSYQPGGSYTGNAALALYAVWEETYVPPDPHIISFSGIWTTVTSKLVTILKNLIIKIVNQENRFLDATTTPIALQIISSKINSLSTYTVDYIVDQGTWGTNGKWIKWNSGIYECWGVFSQSLKLQDQYGNMYYQGEWTSGTWEITQTFPSDFIAAPVVSFNFIRSTGLVVPSVTMTSVSSVKFHIASAQRETTAGTIYYLIKAMGRWK